MNKKKIIDTGHYNCFKFRKPGCGTAFGSREAYRGV